tara:strand:- start:2437 stop:5757 length:3321 start_codon:yes stop_codon:yes gene_type:complete
MALDTGKEKIKIATNDTQVPYVKAKSNFSLAVDAFSPTIERLANEHDITAKAKYMNDFDIKTRDQYIKFQDEFRFDPAGMKAATDAYSNELIDKAPPAYKIAIQAKLNGWSTNSVLSAANNKIKKDDNALISNREITWKNLNADLEYAFKIGGDLPGDEGIKKINIESINGMMNINEKLHNDLVTMVNDKGLVTGAAHDKNAETQVAALLISRGFHIMRAIGDDDQAKAWLYEYSTLKDPYAITIKESFQDNPVYKMTNRLMKDDNSRKEIIEAIKAKYKAFHAATILDLKNSYNEIPTGINEIGSPMHIGAFVGIDNAQNYVDNNFPNIKPADRDKLIDIANTNMQVQSWVSKAIDTGKAHKFIGTNDKISKDKALYTKALLARFGINDIADADITNPNLSNAVNILRQNGLFPDIITNYLNKSNSGDMTISANIDNFKNQIKLTEFMQSIYPGYVPKNAKLLEAINNDWDRNDEYLASAANNWKPKNVDQINQDLSKFNKPENLEFIENKLTNWMENKNIISDAFWMGKFFQDQKNTWTEHVTNDTTTFFPDEAGDMLKANGPLKYQLMEMAAYEWSQMVPAGTEINDPNFENYWNGAMFNAFTRLKEENYYPTKYSGHSNDIIIKDAFEKHYPGINGDQLMNEVYSYIFANYDLNTNKEMEEVFNKGYMAEKKSKLTSWAGLTSSKEERAAAVLEKNKWYSIYDEMVADNEKNITAEWGENNPFDILKIIADNGGKGLIIEPKGHLDGNGKPAYNLALQLPDGNRIDITGANQSFSPGYWNSLAANTLDTPKSFAQFKNNLVNQEYDEFMKEYGHIIGESDFAKRAMHGIIDVAIGMGNWRYYPDMPGVDDVPAEVRPFAWIMKAIGADVDIKELQIKMKKAVSNRSDLIANDKKIAANMDLSDHQKTVEALVPFWQMPHTKANMDLTYNTFAKENYNDKSMNLGIRTNNYFGVHSPGKEKWEGQLDYKVDGNNMAVFSTPEHSARAAVKILINKSSLIENGIKTKYGVTPSLKDIFNMYSEDPSPYFETMAEYGYDKSDRINLLNANEVHRLLKFMMRIEVGKKAFDKYYPPNNHAMLDAVIFKGYESAINSYNGKLGKTWE